MAAMSAQDRTPMCYLNQAGTSWPKPSPVREAVSGALSLPVEAWAESFERQHRDVARAFGVRNPDRLLLTPGATSALSVAILDHDWQPARPGNSSG